MSRNNKKSLRDAAHQLRSGLAAHDRKLVRQALRSIALHVREQDLGDLLHTVLTGAAEVFSEREATLQWTSVLVAGLPGSSSDEIRLLLQKQEFERNHYYQPIKGFISDIEHSLYTIEAMRLGTYDRKQVIHILLHLQSAIVNLAWAFNHPDEYLHWWGGANWDGEGPPPPPHPNIRLSIDDACYASLRKALAPLLKWVEDKATKN